ncbi:MAG: hypothetical protein K0S39_2273 [Paenibacillus sp.]|jgi:hypothetical protein|nr:hypothetical protein [Paenibacillus sp.]
MKGSFIHQEGSRLQLHWADQFMNESERSIEEVDAGTVARTVLFYAGLQLELLFPPAHLPLLHEEAAAAKDWLLASEEDIVEASLERVTRADRRLLQLSLHTVRLHKASALSPEAESELRAYAGPYIRSARERLHRLAEQWFH